jgi:hypothetical protein
MDGSTAFAIGAEDDGYYQGTDPDPFIRSQLMRDPTNH